MTRALKRFSPSESLASAQRKAEQRVDEQLARELQRRGEQPEHREQRKHGKQDKQYFFRYPHFATPSLHVLYTASPLRSLIWRSR